MEEQCNVHALTLASPNKVLVAKRALFDKASSNSLVIRPNGRDKRVSTVVASAGALTPGVVRQCVWGSEVTAREHSRSVHKTVN